MMHLNWKRLYACVLSGTLMATALLALVPPTSAWAHAASLPDFADLVERTSPSVVNIRTLERASSVAGPKKRSEFHQYDGQEVEQQAHRMHS